MEHKNHVEIRESLDAIEGQLKDAIWRCRSCTSDRVNTRPYLLRALGDVQLAIAELLQI